MTVPVLAAAMLGVLAACPGPRVAVVEATVATPAEGTSLAIYRVDARTAFAVIDDRRMVTVTGGSVLLDRIDPAARLPSLVLEPLDGKPFAVTACARERTDHTPAALEHLARARPPIRPDAPDPELPVPPAGVLSPVVRCAVHAPPGQHFIRVVHVAPITGFHAHHEIAFAGDHATMASQYSFVTPGWSGRRAALTMFDGPPGRETPPRELARGAIVLDGAAAVFANAERRVPARVRVIYDGAVRDPETAATHPAWGRETRRTVHAVLELEDVEVPTGVIDVRIALPDQPTREVVVPANEREVVGRTLRLGLWVDEALHGARRTTVTSDQRPNGKALRQRFQISVSNRSEHPREIWIEERLRPLKREIVDPPPGQTVIDHVARLKVTLPPGGTHEIDFSVIYRGL